MKKQLFLTGFGLFLTVGAIGLKPNLQGWVLAAGGSLVSVGVVLVNSQNKAIELEQKLKSAASHAHRAIGDFQELKTLYSTAISDRDRLKLQFQGITSIKDELERENKRIIEKTSLKDGEIAKIQAEMEYKDEIIQEWKSQFQSRLDAKLNEEVRRVRDVRDREVGRYKSLASEGLELLGQLDRHVNKIKTKNSHQDELVSQIVSRHNMAVAKVEQTLTSERDGYLTQIDALNERVGVLQSQLAGGVIEPGYLDVQSLDIGAKLGNSLVRYLYSQFDIPCVFTGYKAQKLGLRASIDLKSLIQQENQAIKAFLGIHEIKCSESLAPGFFEINFQVSSDHKGDRDRLMRPRGEFLPYLESHPIRFRLVGSPGSGKTPLANVIIRHIEENGFRRGNTPSGSKLQHLQIMGLDPLAGVSSKNDGNNPYTVWCDAESGFEGINHEYQLRKQKPKKDDGIVFLIDELDNAISSYSDGGKIIKSLLKDGGHLNLGIICLGQSSMVSSTGKNGLTIDDQKMFLNIFLDSKSMRSFFSNYGEKWYSKNTINEALRSLEEIEIIAEQENKIIVDSGRKYRFCLVLGERSPVFFELPFFG